MPRKARKIIAGAPHHLTQRTIRRLPLFDCDNDRLKYLTILNEEKKRYGLKIWSYCLMDNHIHLVVVPPADDALSKAIRNAHSRYSRYYNARQGHAGHLLQSRFYSCPMDLEYLWNAIRYVERNPVEADIVDHAGYYKWSSAPFRCGFVTRDDILDSFPGLDNVKDWYEWLGANEDLEVVRKLVNATLEGSWLGHRAPSPKNGGERES